ncbi:MAG: Rrf2 family transcriptional regulator [Oscillospiraceae bacterium]|nr:Rrf2 family transcriptional regulator [bacterium]MDY5101124.1 Rrf2 family transcriptional regulator [Oscillospiraceae bacterium]
MHISNKCSIALHCLLFIHEYGGAKKVTSELLSLSTGCNPVTIRNLISAMRKDGIIDVKSGTGGATIAVPLREITLYRVCAAVDPEALDKMIGIHAAPSPFCPVGRNIRGVLDQTYGALRADMIESMQSITLEKLVADYHAALEK